MFFCSLPLHDSQVLSPPLCSPPKVITKEVLLGQREDLLQLPEATQKLAPADRLKVPRKQRREPPRPPPHLLGHGNSKTKASAGTIPFFNCTRGHETLRSSLFKQLPSGEHQPLGTQPWHRGHRGRCWKAAKASRGKAKSRADRRFQKRLRERHGGRPRAPTDNQGLAARDMAQNSNR